MSDETGYLRERTRRTVLHTLGSGLGAVALATGATLTAAGGGSEREQRESTEKGNRPEPLLIHGPTTVYPANEHHHPGVFGELENVSDRTVWLARLDVTFYDDDERPVGTRRKYFLRLHPGEQRSIEIPFTDEWFDDRSLTLDSGLLQVVL